MSMCDHHWWLHDGLRECLRCGHTETANLSPTHIDPAVVAGGSETS